MLFQMVGVNLATALGRAGLQGGGEFEILLTLQNQPLGSSAHHPATAQLTDSVLGCVCDLDSSWAQYYEFLKYSTESDMAIWAIHVLIPIARIGSSC